jgi:hypothetical protein
MVIFGCKKDQYIESSIVNSKGVDRFDDIEKRVIQEIKDSLLYNPQTLAFINELGTLEYASANIAICIDSTFLVQIPILADGSDEVVNLLEVFKLNGRTFNTVHQKEVIAILKNSGKYLHLDPYFDLILNKFENAQRAYDRFFQLVAVYNDGSKCIYDGQGALIGCYDSNGNPPPQTASCYSSTGFGLMYILIDGQQFEPGDFPDPQSNPTSPLYFTVYGPNYHSEFTPISVFTFMEGFPTYYPPIVIDPGLNNGNPLGPQGVPINILSRARQSIQATYGITFDVNFLIQFFGLDCIMHIGTTVTPNNLYLESDCIEDVLSQSQLISSLFQEQYANSTGIELTSTQYQEVIGENCPPIFGYDAYAMCMTSIISQTLAQNLVECSGQNLNQQVISNLLANYISTNPGASFSQLNSLCPLISSLTERQISSAFQVATTVGASLSGLQFLLGNPDYVAFAADLLSANLVLAQAVIKTYT